METLKELRKERKLTQKELAEKAGISIATYQRYERGERSPTFETLFRIYEALESSEEEIISHLIQQSGLITIANNINQDRNDAIIMPKILKYGFDLLNEKGQIRVLEYWADISKTKYSQSYALDPYSMTDDYSALRETTFDQIINKELTPIGSQKVKLYIEELIRICEYRKQEDAQHLYLKYVSDMKESSKKADITDLKALISSMKKKFDSDRTLASSDGNDVADNPSKDDAAFNESD